MNAAVRVCVLMLLWFSLDIAAREWTDSTGTHTQEADLVDFDDRLAVLKKADGRLVAVPIAKLSAADRQYLRTLPARKVRTEADALHTWELLDGQRIEARIRGYGHGSLLIESNSGVLRALDEPFDDLAAIQKRVLLAIVSVAEGINIENEQQLAKILQSKPGSILQYSYDGVALECDDGHSVLVPFFAFAENDRQILKSNWHRRSATRDTASKSEEKLFLRSLLNEYRRNNNLQRKIDVLKLASEWFDLWEVLLIPERNQTNAIASVVVPARNSGQAKMAAVGKYPNAQIIAIHKLPRRD